MPYPSLRFRIAAVAALAVLTLAGCQRKEAPAPVGGGAMSPATPVTPAPGGDTPGNSGAGSGTGGMGAGGGTTPGPASPASRPGAGQSTMPATPASS